MRNSSGWILMILAVAGSAWFVHTTPLGWNLMPWWSSAGTGVLFMALFTGPAVALLSAWQSAKQAKWGYWDHPHVRSRLQVMLDWFAPALVACAGAPVVGVLSLMPGRLGRFDATVLAMSVVLALCLLASAGLGAALGRHLPAPAALPLSVLVPFLAIGFPEGISWMPLRHMVGTHSSCCDIGSVLDERAIQAPLIFHGLLLVTFVAAWTRRSRLWALGVVVLGLCVAGLASWAIVRPLQGPDPLQPRSVSALECVGKDPEVCLWPEQRAMAAATRVRAQEIYSGLRKLGVDTPIRVGAEDSAEWVASLDPSESPTQLDGLLETSLVQRPVPSCAFESGASYTYPDVQSLLAEWVYQRTSPTPDAPSVRVAAILKRSDSEQVKWFRGNLAQAGQCNVAPLR